VADRLTIFQVRCNLNLAFHNFSPERLTMGESMKVFHGLLEERHRAEGDTGEIDARINALFGETWAVLCSDMSGFTRRTDEFGILHFLTLIHGMQELMKPIAHHHHGLVLKEEADNLLILFRDVRSAAACALAMHRATASFNKGKPPDSTIEVCLGLGYGEILKIGDEDCFGAEVNRAFKLGEDIANAGETLLTPEAATALGSLPGARIESVGEPSRSAILTNYFRLVPIELE
jgi:adenylate cyclase